MVFVCKKCKKAFRKDMENYEESDEYCPHCDNHYVIEAKTPQAVLGVEGEDTRVDARMLKDERMRQDATRSIFRVDDSDNDALQVNPPAGDRHITTHASDWLWAVFAVMLLSWFGALGWAYADRRRNRIFHFIPLIVLAVSFVAYFSMASDLGWTLIRAEFRGDPTRQIWYVRYIQWFINAPLILLALLSFTSMSTPAILTVLFFSWFLVVNGLVGALVHSSYKWGYFVFGLFGLFFIWYQLLGHVNLYPFRNADYRGGYFVGAAYISFIWVLYPICWGLSEGGNRISPTSEMVFYGILDIMSGPVFLLGFMGYASTLVDSPAFAPTAFGTAERGLYEGAAPPQKGGQPTQGTGAANA
ncbi:hypothetical protein JVU11DRAFT_7640 [Chiua virens]|nr:hypothetical protein JVU11DRAFT_7640 [Chiua virens]